MSERQKNLVRWAYNVTREVMKTTPLQAMGPQGQVPDWKWLSGLLDNIASDDAMLERIVNTRDDFYTKTGTLLQEILLKAADDKKYREIVLKGYQCDKSKKWYWQCDLPWEWGLWDLTKFKIYNTLWFGSSLKNNLDGLEAFFIAQGIEESDVSKLKVDDFDKYEFQMKLFVKLAPRLRDLISLPCELYLGKFLQEVDVDELRDVLEKFNLLLKGALKAAKPRHQRT